MLTEYPIEFIDVTRSMALSGARVKGSYAMSYADCIATALTMSLNAIVVTGDPEFRLVEHLLPIEWLLQRQRS
jgi:predicted nucleic acid-binding protein